jgi:hypothetical protein
MRRGHKPRQSTVLPLDPPKNIDRESQEQLNLLSPVSREEAAEADCAKGKIMNAQAEGADIRIEETLKQAWVVPELKRLKAGSAEDDTGTLDDAIATQS